MATKVTFTKGREDTPTFGRGELLISSQCYDQIVMVAGEGKDTDQFAGVNINGRGWPTGYYSASWDKKSFKVFDGTITLESL